MATARTIITEAFRKITVLGDGETPTASEASNALSTLNDMIAEWSAESLMIHSRSQDNFALVVGTGSYTIGSGGTVNTTRPHEIVGAFVRDSGNTDYPVEIITRDRYNAEPSKTTQGRPYRLYYDPTLTLGTIKLFPVPEAAETLFIDSLKPFTQFTSLDATAPFPAEYNRALVLNLGVELLDEYPRKVSDRLFQRAALAKAAIKRLNWTPLELRTEFARMPYNINNG